MFASGSHGLTVFQIFIILFSGILVGIADALIKKTTLSGSFLAAVTNIWMLVIILLYLAQIALFIYVFTNNWELGVVGILQMVFYSFTVIIIGILGFHEMPSLIKGTGMGLAIAGIVLMNI